MGVTAANSKYPCPYCKISFPVNNKGQFSVTKNEIREFKVSLLKDEWNLDTQTDSSALCYRTSNEAFHLIKNQKLMNKKVCKYIFNNVVYFHLHYYLTVLRIQASSISKNSRL